MSRFPFLTAVASDWPPHTMSASHCISWIWFAPPSSQLNGGSVPGTPCRSPTSGYAPHNSSPLATRSSHMKTRSQDSTFNTLASPAPDRRLPTDRDLHASPPEDARSSPPTRFTNFVREIIRTTQVSTSVLISALLYLRRLKLLHPQLKGYEGSEYRVCITAMMLGNKALDDHTYTNRTWSDISGIALVELNRCEIEFFLGLQMRIHVTVSEYEDWQQTLEDLYEQRARAIAKREKEAARRKATAMSAWQAPPLVMSTVPTVQQPPAPVHSAYRHSFSHPLAYGQVEQAPQPALSPLDSSILSAFSPTSQQSYGSTAATSISPGTVTGWPSPEEYTNCGNLNGLVLPRPTNDTRLPATSSLPTTAHDTAGQSSYPCTRASGSSGQKRRRPESGGDTPDTLSQKRLALCGPEKSQSQSSAMAPTTVGSMRNSLSPEERFYRSLFQQPLTPDKLLQPFAVPQPSLPTAPAVDRQQPLSFYQLAAGRDYGLPAYHLPPPPMQSAAMSRAPSRRGSMGLSAYGISPRTSIDASECQRRHPGHNSHGNSVSSYNRNLAHPARLSPEAYGVSYGLDQQQDKRWMPFNNVPIEMQLRQMEIWQQLHYHPPSATANQQPPLVQHAQHGRSGDWAGQHRSSLAYEYQCPASTSRQGSPLSLFHYDAGNNGGAAGSETRAKPPQPATAPEYQFTFSN